MVLGAALVSACGAPKQTQGAMMNQFISKEKLGAVSICKTTGQQLQSSLGAPNGQGRDGNLATLTWMAAAVVSDSEQVAVGTQSVYAWIDADGLVAGFVVNPTGIPEKPLPCRDQNAAPPADPQPTGPGASAKPSTA